MATDPVTVDLAAKQSGLPILERLRALRTGFGLSLTAAKTIVDATDGRPPLFPEINTPDQLKTVLETEFGYCGCASAAALIVLRNLLHAAEARTTSVNTDMSQFSNVSRELETLLNEGGGWAEWLVYSLDQKGFVWHGFRQTDLWITDKGRLLLLALDRNLSTLSSSELQAD
jgi:hypothetical protein